MIWASACCVKDVTMLITFKFVKHLCMLVVDLYMFV